MSLRGKFNGAKHITEARAFSFTEGVGERPMRGEVAAKAAVDFMGVRMPE